MLVVYPMHWIDPQISFSVGRSVCLWTDRLSNDYVHSSLPIFTKFCTRLRNLVASSHIVLRQTGSSLPSFGGVRVPILAVFRLWWPHFQQISTKSHMQIKFSNADLVFNYSMVNETGNRNQILEMCKFRIWFRLIISSTILYQFSPNFACGSEIGSFRRLLFVRQTRTADFVLNGEWNRK